MNTPSPLWCFAVLPALVVLWFLRRWWDATRRRDAWVEAAHTALEVLAFALFLVLVWLIYVITE